MNNHAFVNLEEAAQIGIFDMTVYDDASYASMISRKGIEDMLRLHSVSRDLVIRLMSIVRSRLR